VKSGRRATAWRAGLVACALASAACMAGPTYVRPEPPAPLPEAFKEAGTWKVAEPSDGVSRGNWWEVFGDERLNALEAQLSVSNQTLKAAQAQFDQARALLRSAQSALYPQVGSAAAIAATDQSENRPLRNRTTPTRYDDYLLRLDVSYEADVWGRVRSTTSAARAGAQATAADLESVTLSLRTDLAANYFLLRALDAEAQILDSSVAALERALELTTNRHQGGIASLADVAQAEAQLHATRAQAIDVRARRATVEHAIAVLVGVPASSFSLPPLPLAADPPVIQPDVPSALLERRPDIAAAERRVAAANAQIGVAASAFYPLVLLTGNAGFEAASVGDWLKAASGFWSIAPAAVLTIFDGGRRRAVSAQARAAHERTVANYREVVLGAFREVEDNLALLRVLAEEAEAQTAAVAAADRALTLAKNRYRGGVASYLEVVVVQNAALTNRRVELGIQSRRYTASVLLIKALGGNWDASKLPPL
jgi:NodT family efflux transporter outer membrane factor (OMF) lipoprotein